MKKCPRCGKQYVDANTLCPSDGAVLQREDELVGQTLAGKYRIEEKISEGGMGCVYRATHILMEKVLAVKVLHPALAADDTIVARFTREAKAASRISHPHAITVTDFGESENGVVFLVMEYLRGRTLKEVVRSEGPMSLKRVAEIVRQVAGALETAHSEGVVHRDLKSDNIMLDETTGGGDWAKVLDFGIAKIKEPVDAKPDSALTAPNLIIGTPQYMSPEQCSQASSIDARSDIYSLGVIIFEMLAGHVPFSGDSPTETMMKQMQEPVPSLREDRSDLPEAVDQLVQRAMAKSPDERFQSVSELSETLLLAASENPVLEEAASIAATTVVEKSALTDGKGSTAPSTNRIVVSTGENEPPRATGGEEVDEETVVRSRTRRERESNSFVPVPPAPAATSFNPWRIAIPAFALLAVVFGLFYFLQQGETSGEAQQPPLSSDANSQPVVSITPPTGEGERNITPSNATAPLPTAQSEGGTASAPSNANANAAVVDSPTPEKGEEENDNTGEEEEAKPSPTATPASTNKRNPTPPPPTKDANVRPEQPSKPAPTPPPPAKADVPAPLIPNN